MSTTPLEATPILPMSQSARAMRRHASAYALFSVASSIRFTQAIWLIYLAEHGYSPFAIGLFEMLFHLAKLVAEVPTGVFADLVGRRASLIAACAVGAVSELLFLAPAPPIIALSLALAGISWAFRGGADAALLWGMADQADARGVAERFTRLYSWMFIMLLIGEAIGTTTGGALATLAIALPFLAQSAMQALSILPLLTIPEQRAGEHHRLAPLAHVGEGLRAVRRDPVLLGLLLLSGLLAGVFTTVSIYSQLFFTTLGLSIAAVGLVYGVTVGPNVLYAALAPRLIARLPRAWLLGGCVTAESLGLLAMRSGQPVVAVAGFVLLFYATDSVTTAAISRYLNERAPEAQRATVLSLDTGLFSATMIVLFPLFGLGLTHVPFTVAYTWVLLALAGGSVAIGVSTQVLARRRSDNMPAR
jgi:MFS family permease